MYTVYQSIDTVLLSVSEFLVPMDRYSVVKCQCISSTNG